MNLKDRIKLLEEAAQRGEKIAVCVVQDKGSAQFRYRCENITEVTLDSKKWQTIWFLNSEISVVLDRVDKIKLVIIVRQAAKNNKILNFIDKLRDNNVKVLFDLDDLVFDIAGVFSLMVAIGSWNFVGWFGYMWGVHRIAKKVDGFIATNDFLANRLKKSFKKPAAVISNSLNKKQIEISKDFSQKEKDNFIIGYFSGSPTHVRDFRLIESELIDFLHRHDDVKMWIVGYMEFSSKIKKMITSGKIKTIKPLDYLKLQKLMAKVDVNIAPLLINDFTNCKSELKYFEAAIVRTTTIASPNYAFKKAIKDGENGFLAQPGEWCNKIEYLYKNPEKNKKIAEKAREYALKHYFGKEFLKEVENAYDFFSK